MGRETRAVWRERVRRWGESGLTAAEFARYEGVREATLRHWRWQLGAGRRRQSRESRARFVEIVPARAAGISEEGFEVMLESGTRVRVPAVFDGDALAKLLSALQSARA
jgi:transposase